MQLQKVLRQRLAAEYRYAVDRMQQENQAQRKLYYFSVFFGEAQRVLNIEWDRDICLVQMLTQASYNSINAQFTMLGTSIPINPTIIFDQLTQVSSDLASYFEKKDEETTRDELYQILTRLAEVTYLAGGNGAYLFEKGIIKF